ncbi:hypothetical protein NE686_18145 [Tissierella carlieri]|uniref:Uncharacterized protein n=1 Tax=Tissierella carlieri TaxID=689904 RepID=A0ABT1SEW3_9FIRM|nr:hypothetical protein [Tissierella carlieri]MCQ4925028.1 hypothetical protein [Tissierella carlieri]
MKINVKNVLKENKFAIVMILMTSICIPVFNYRILYRQDNLAREAKLLMLAAIKILPWIWLSCIIENIKQYINKKIFKFSFELIEFMLLVMPMSIIAINTLREVLSIGTLTLAIILFISELLLSTIGKIVMFVFLLLIGIIGTASDKMYSKYKAVEKE